MPATSGDQHGMTVHGYCVHCRTQRVMVNTIQVCNRRGRYDLKGNCSACGKGMYRLGGWDAAVQAAEPENVASASNNRI